METRYFKEYSRYLDRDMEFKMYGDSGILCLIIPCQDGRFYEWEDRKMFELMKPFMDEGRVQFVTIDTIDKETWSDYGPSDHRMYMQESWINYIVNELLPSVHEKAGKDPDEPMMVMGCSLGGTHAANLFFRFPQKFNKLLAMSGVYDLSCYIHDNNFDGNYYQNSPLAYMPNMEASHPYIDLYNQNKGFLVVGQGDWENQTANDLRRLADVLYQKGICTSCYFWGTDTPHDWPSWEKQILEYLPQLV